MPLQAVLFEDNSSLHSTTIKDNESALINSNCNKTIVFVVSFHALVKSNKMCCMLFIKVDDSALHYLRLRMYATHAYSLSFFDRNECYEVVVKNPQKYK